MAKTKENDTGIPQHEIESLARCLLPAIQKFFESEEGQKEFAKWKAKQKKLKKTEEIEIQIQIKQEDKPENKQEVI